MVHFLRFCLFWLLKGFANGELGLSSRLHVDTGVEGEGSGGSEMQGICGQTLDGSGLETEQT